MNGEKLFVDTNILIYLLQGDSEISEILNGKDIVISFITELELLSFPKLKESETKSIRELISECKVLGINQKIKESTVTFRSNYGLKLPDAIIAASAEYFNIPLFTADTAFEKVNELNIVLFET